MTNLRNGFVDPSHQENPIIGINFHSSLAFTPWIFNPTCANQYSNLVFTVHLPIVDSCLFHSDLVNFYVFKFLTLLYMKIYFKSYCLTSLHLLSPFAWKSYNRNLSFKHFSLIHYLNNFAPIWNISLHRLHVFVFMIFH